MDTAVRPEYLDNKQAETYSGLSRTTLWRLVKAGEIEAIKLGRLVRYRRESLDAYMARNAYDADLSTE